MTNKLTSVTAKRNDIVRGFGSKQDCLINKVLSLQNNATELEDKLSRIAGRPGWGAELDGTRAMLADHKREQDGLVKAGTSMV
jgi:hypothetical protein